MSSVKEASVTNPLQTTKSHAQVLITLGILAPKILQLLDLAQEILNLESIVLSANPLLFRRDLAVLLQSGNGLLVERGLLVELGFERFYTET